MFIRHGEKPADDGPPHGVNVKGEKDPHSLSIRGWTRAGALAARFSQEPLPAPLAVPGRIIATKSNDDYRSRREIDTATPLARRLGLSVDEDFSHKHAQQMSASVLADARPTLVVWHHGSMPEVLAEFPVSNAADVPTQWPEDRFDLVWTLQRDPDGQTYRYACVVLELLDGDGAAA